MSKGFFNVPVAKNEPVLSYAPGTPERKELQAKIAELRSREVELPMIIGGKEVFTDRKERIFPPHEIEHTLGYYNQGVASHVEMAIDAALEAKENAQMPPQFPTFSSAQDFILWLSTQRNDLQDPARRLVPEIDAVIAELDACPECLLSRMSGSGATCFGLFTSLSDAERASSDISKRYPNWWVKPVKLGSMDKAALPELN